VRNDATLCPAGPHGPAGRALRLSTVRPKENSMTAKPPPVPPANQSHKGTGDAKMAPLDTAGHKGPNTNPDQTGQQGNSKQNTTNQGYQQDR
jgi:hypothetical protein